MLKCLISTFDEVVPLSCTHFCGTVGWHWLSLFKGCDPLDELLFTILDPSDTATFVSVSAQTVPATFIHH